MYDKFIEPVLGFWLSIQMGYSPERSTMPRQIGPTRRLAPFVNAPKLFYGS